MDANPATVTENEWQGRTGDSWASQWRRTDRSFGPLTEHLLRRTRDFAFTSVLDIGCGAGELSLAVARGRPQCRVVGVDISPQLIDVARTRGANLDNAVFEVADAGEWRPANGAPDLLISRHGVMFFDDPAAVFAHLRGHAAPGAGLLFSCFRAREENALFTEAGRLLTEPLPPSDPTAPGPFAFADRARVEAILAAAGWRDIAFEPLEVAMVVGAGEDPLEDAADYFSTIGPAARVASSLGPDARHRFRGRARELAARHLREGIVSLSAAVWIVTARGQ